MPVGYNDIIKAPGTEIEYSSEMIKDLKKCSEDFRYFTKFVKIVTEEGRVLFEPREFQIELYKKILSNRYSIFLISRQSGKCVYFQSVIKIRNKKTMQIEEISIGEFFNKFIK